MILVFNFVSQSRKVFLTSLLPLLVCYIIPNYAFDGLLMT